MATPPSLVARRSFMFCGADCINLHGAVLEIAAPDSLIVLTHVDDANTPPTASTELTGLAR